MMKKGYMVNLFYSMLRGIWLQICMTNYFSFTLILTLDYILYFYIFTIFTDSLAKKPNAVCE